MAPGKAFREFDTCLEMVVIPSVSFRMGDTNGDGEKAERPVREVRIGYNFAVGKYEVTQTSGWLRLDRTQAILKVAGTQLNRCPGTMRKCLYVS